MVLDIKIKNEILDLLKSEHLPALIIVGKMGKNTSIELMRIIKSIDDDPDSMDLFFAYHYPFQKLSSYFQEILKDLKEQHESLKEEIDPNRNLETIFQRYLIYKEGQEATVNFVTFLKHLAGSLKDRCRNIVFVLDPETISDPLVFNTNINYIIQNIPKNVKLIIFEDTEGEKQAEIIKKRKDVKQFRIPSSVEEIIQFMEREIVENKQMPNRQRADYIHNLGNIYRGVGKKDKALVKYQQVIKWFSQNKLVKEECMVLNDIALLYYIERDIENAIKYYQKCLEITSTNNLFPLSNFCINQIAKIHLEADRKTEAIKYYRKGLEIADKAKDISGKGNILSSIGDLQVSVGRSDDALKTFMEALTLSRKTGNFFGEARELNKISQIYRKKGKADDAKRYEVMSKQIQKEKKFSLEVPQADSTNQQ